ncbi:2-oxo acid dehydrogenase subunit E2 [Acuticoccus sp. MNP-M23]|uniref:2-oxo acid dehydrogenase subunit E2 n=1 Tax=Acuticoccus sp. MNP-M23 TaxID=3072793 RepID=UPI0028164BAA|nr:2-oxo acid dehydrogenase subunit E2 [Acuticoccus sp. MNP-M23]WMS41357.1 2-oxo acid dehydrogenase subunit E2 [Acuticoccus sp. MNP-M23]
MNYTASPSTRTYAANNSVDLDALARATGRSLIGREDVDAFLSGTPRQNAAAPASASPERYWDVDHAAFGPVREEPVAKVFRAAAANLSAASAMIPQVTHHDRADMRAVESLRAAYRSEAEQRGVRLTALAFHVAALARCLIEFPRFNASLKPGGETLVLKDYVHIGIAVDTPAGLMVPVIRNADRKGLFEIAREIGDLAKRAQARKLRPDEMGGASMSISNLGAIGGCGFTPIVNPPEVAILGITRTETVPVWDNAAWQPVPMVPLDLSYDHRVVNGADAARFLSRFATLIAEPRRLLVQEAAL